MTITKRKALVNTGFLWIVFGVIIYIVGLLWQNVSNAPASQMQIFGIVTIFFIIFGLYYIIQAFVTKDKED